MPDPVTPTPPVPPAPVKPAPVAKVAPTIPAGPVACWYLDQESWLPGTVVQWPQPNSAQPQNAMVIVAAADGTFATVPISDVRHGAKPVDLPRIHAALPGGLKRHTITKRHGKWIIASPDGVIVRNPTGEYGTDEEGTKLAKAHFEKLEAGIKADIKPDEVAA